MIAALLTASLATHPGSAERTLDGMDASTQGENVIAASPLIPRKTRLIIKFHRWDIA